MIFVFASYPSFNGRLTGWTNAEDSFQKVKMGMISVISYITYDGILLLKAHLDFVDGKSSQCISSSILFLNTADLERICYILLSLCQAICNNTITEYGKKRESRKFVIVVVVN